MKPFYKLTLDAEQRAFVDAIRDTTATIVFCNAAAGTGKTTLAFGAANLLYYDKRNSLDGIVYIVSDVCYSFCNESYNDKRYNEAEKLTEYSVESDEDPS